MIKTISRLAKLIAVIIILWMIFSLSRLIQNVNLIQQKQLAEIDSLEKHLGSLEDRVNDLKISRDQLSFEIISKEVRDNSKTNGMIEILGENLATEIIIRNEYEDLIKFLNGISSHEKFEVNITDWRIAIENITYNTFGKRRNTLLLALSLASENLKFKLGGSTPQQGFDSSSFIKYVLESSGIDIRLYSGKKLSENLMQNFMITENPTPGDLIVYGGDIGNFCLIYLGKSVSTGKNIGVGVLDTNTPYIIMDTNNLNSFFEQQFIGYFKVPYEN